MNVHSFSDPDTQTLDDGRPCSVALDGTGETTIAVPLGDDPSPLARVLWNGRVFPLQRTTDDTAYYGVREGVR